MTDIAVTIAPTVQFNCSVTVGAVGPGVASGGTTAQVLRKASNTSYDTEWHTLTKADVDLANVDDTRDFDKPVSTATQTALDAKVDENAAITGATKTKITYDAKGLVTSGADATAADVGAEPTISAGTTAQYWRGDKSWRDFFTDVRAATLTGLSLATSQAIAATDSVLLALGYLQAQITAIGVANSTAVKTALNASGSAPVYACRAWVNFNGTGTIAIRASGNVSSITDAGAGIFRPNLTVAMADTNYSPTVNCYFGTGAANEKGVSIISSSQYQINLVVSSAGFDSASVFSQVFGS